MNPSTRATATAVAATVIAATGFLGTRYLAIGIAALIVVAAIGWPRLFRLKRRRVGTAVILAAGVIAIGAVGFGRGEPYLRYAVAAAAASIMLALAAEVLFPSPPGRAVGSVAAMAAGAAVAVSAAAWVAAARTPGSQDLVVAGAATLAMSGLTSVLTKKAHVNAAISMVVGVLSGLGMGLAFDSIGWFSGAIVGAIGAALVLLITELTQREAAPKAVMAVIASGVTPVLSAGVLVYLGGRLLVG